jgi:hypothetical protein
VNETQLDEEERAEHLAGGIYGTIVVAGLIAATGPDDDPEVLSTAFWIVATVVVFWLAHSWSLFIARRATGVVQPGHGLRHSLARNWPIAQSAIIPLAVMVAASLLGATDETAIFISGLSCVVLLAAWGAIVGRREQESGVRVVMTSISCAALGGLMIGLKVLIH